MGHTRKAVALWNLRGEKIRDKRQGVLQGRSGFSAKRTVTVQKWEGLYYIRAAVGQESTVGSKWCFLLAAAGGPLVAFGALFSPNYQLEEIISHKTLFIVC